MHDFSWCDSPRLWVRHSFVEDGALRVDNVAVTAGVGTTVAADDAAGVYYQKVKIADGTTDGTTCVPASANGLFVQGQAAADAAMAGNPVVAGAKTLMTGSLAEMNADADVVTLLADRTGTQYVNAFHPNSWSFSSSVVAAQADAVVKAAGAANICHYITDVVIGASAAMNAYFEEAAATVLGPFYIAGAGTICIHFRTPKKLTAATELTVTTSLAAAHSIEVHGFSAH